MYPPYHPSYHGGRTGQASSVTRLRNFLKPVATIILPKSPTLLGNFCKGVKIFHFSSEIIFGQLYRHLATFTGHTASKVGGFELTFG